MNKREFISKVASELKDSGVRKPVVLPRQTFTISDNSGNSKQFYVKQTDKLFVFSVDDVEKIVDACLDVIEDCLKHGDVIAVQKFGSLGLNYRKPRVTQLYTPDGEQIITEGKYVPKFTAGERIKRACTLYKMSLSDRESEPVPIDTGIDDGDELYDYDDTSDVESGGDE